MKITSPEEIIGSITDVSTGDIFAAAVDKNGDLWTWGDNRDGQLGNGGTGNHKENNYYYQTYPQNIIPLIVSFASDVDGWSFVNGEEGFGYSSVSAIIINETIHL